jgi:hypothetical protein
MSETSWKRVAGEKETKAEEIEKNKVTTVHSVVLNICSYMTKKSGRHRQVPWEGIPP